MLHFEYLCYKQLAMHACMHTHVMYVFCTVALWILNGNNCTIDYDLLLLKI